MDVDAADVSVDAFPVFSCWPSIPPIERGTVTLGTGDTAFAPLAATLPVVYGSAGDFLVWVRVRMTDFLPGQPSNVANENPFTRVRATFADTGVALSPPGDCASRQWYVPNALGGFDLASEHAVMFDSCWQSDRLIGARVQIDVELMDATGSYAQGSRVVTLTEPVGGFPSGPTPPTCGM